MPTVIEKYNALEGKTLKRATLQKLMREAKKQGETEISDRLFIVLDSVKNNNSFFFESVKKIKPASKPKISPGPKKKKPSPKPQKPAPKKQKPTPKPKSKAKKSLNGTDLALKNLGFQQASAKLPELDNVIEFNSPLGFFLQKIQHHQGLILIKGQKHSSKSQLAMQIANQYAAIGEPVPYFDYEQGGTGSKDTRNSLEWNTDPENRHLIFIKGDVDDPMAELQEACKFCKVVIADSVTDMKITADQLNDLRRTFPEVVWIFIAQMTNEGKMYGGGKMAHNPTMIIHCHPDPDPKKRTATLEKNRGNDLNRVYEIYNKVAHRIIPEKIET